MTTLQKGKLYRVEVGNNLSGGMFPTITFQGVSGTLNLYFSNYKPSSLSEMVSETVDDVSADINFPFANIIGYMAISGTGTATRIESGVGISFTEISDIS